jgi:hypothetical protein
VVCLGVRTTWRAFCKKLDPVEHAVLFLKNRASTSGFYPGRTLTRLSSQVQGKHTHPNGQNIGMDAPSNQRREDLEVVIRHVKEDLFPNVKFLYEPKLDLAVGGKIYRDYKVKCERQLAAHIATTTNRDLHLQGIWTDPLTKHAQKNALAQKRSAVCTVMQNKFLGKSAISFFTAARFIPSH